MSDTTTTTGAPATGTITTGTTTTGAPATTTTGATATTTTGAPATGTQTTQDQKDTLLTGAENGTTAQQGTPPNTQVAEIEIKVPDGVEVDGDLLGKFKPLAKEFGLDSARAQKMVDLYVEAQKGFSEKINTAWNEQKEKWRGDVQRDSEIGGAKFNETVTVARRAIDKFGGPALKAALNELGIGNHPEIVRFAYRVGKAISEDSIAGTGGSAPTVSDEEAMLRTAFPSMFSDKK